MNSVKNIVFRKVTLCDLIFLENGHMSKTFSDGSSDPITISPAQGESAPRPKCKESEVQTDNDLITPTVDVQTAPDPRVDIGTSSTGVKYAPPKIDDYELYQFLKKIEPIALRELVPTSAYQYLEKKINSTNIVLKSSFETDSQFSVSGLSINCTGSTVAVALEVPNHYGFCKHSTQLHFISTVSNNRHEIPLDSCVTALKYHPHYPAIIAMGHHTGEVSVIRNDDKWAQTKLGDSHLNRIVAVDWLADRQTVMALVSASVEGLICVWTLKGRNSRTKFLEQCSPMKISDKDGSISCMTVIPNSSDALVGLESGAIVRVPLPFECSFVQRERQFYSGHTGPVVNISICPIAPGLCVSVGSDELFCIRNSVVNDPLSMSILLNCQLFDCAWSVHSPSVVAVVAVDRVVIMDFCVSATQPILSFDAPNANKVVWNENIPGTLIVGCTDGKVLFFGCEEGGLEQRPGANRLMSQWEAQTKTVLSSA
ncbi:hypothetical protein TRFO_16082 [Tritrichomonas foetus]|uniref:WD repeat-containing protein 34 n=1 Tax=Tritrichomonas foetus TaxID=1144522 RepID=A0A1J4KVM6_9EUKA|nr:hypothetical protein TRFO_16082 [Tritrichomonas foetus]|eukprot:OHT13750.1 hypothetical protein TRFO_16082 [Tritrichomonas foetus]